MGEIHTHDSRSHGKQNLGNDLWKHMDSTQERRIIFDTLEEDRQVVIDAEKDAKKDKRVRWPRSNDSRAKYGE